MNRVAMLRKLQPSSRNFRNAAKIGLGLGLVSGAAEAWRGAAIAKGHAKDTHEANLSKAKAVLGALNVKTGERNAQLENTLVELKKEILGAAQFQGFDISITELRAKGNGKNTEVVIGLDGPDMIAAGREFGPLIRKYALMLGKQGQPSPELQKLMSTKATFEAPPRPDYSGVAGTAGAAASAAIAAGLTLALTAHFTRKGVSLVKRLVRRRPLRPAVAAMEQKPDQGSQKPGNGNGGAGSQNSNGQSQAKILKGGPRPPSERRSAIVGPLNLARELRRLAAEAGLQFGSRELSGVVNRAMADGISPQETGKLRALLPKPERNGAAGAVRQKPEKDSSFRGISPMPVADMRRFLVSLGFHPLPRTGTGHQYFEGRNQSNKKRVKVPIPAHSPGERTLGRWLIGTILREIGLTPQEFERLRRGERK